MTLGAFQTAFGGGSYDAFVTKVNPSGSGVVYSTYIGGSDADIANGIAVGASGDAYATGLTYSTNFPTTVGAFQPAFGGGSFGGFFSKPRPNGFPFFLFPPPRR